MPQQTVAKKNRPAVRTQRKLAAYVSIADTIREQISSRGMEEGDLLPSHRELALEHNVSIATIQQAVGLLVTEGVLATRPNRGLFVNNGGSPKQTLSARTPEPTYLAPQKLAPAKTSRLTNLAHVGVIAFLPPYIGEAEAPIGATHDYAGELLLERPTNIKATIVRSIEKAIGAAGGSTSFLLAGDSRIRSAQLLAEAMIEIRAQDVQAVALVYMEPDIITGALRIIGDWNLPTVFVNDEFVRVPMPIVYYDQVEAGSKVGAHLIERGCRKLLFYSTSDLKWVTERLEGVRDAMRFAGIDESQLSVQIGHIEGNAKPLTSIETSEAYADEVLGRVSHFDGVIAANDQIAYGFIQAAERKGLKAGLDFAIAGFDDRVDARTYELTSLHPPLEDMGKACAELLIDLLTAGMCPSQVCLHSHLVIRSSSRHPFPGGSL